MTENKKNIKVNVKIGAYISPEKPFVIINENYISGAIPISEVTWAGPIKKFSYKNQVIVEIIGSYSERMVPSLKDFSKLEMKGFSKFRGPSTTIKMNLIENEIYYLCDHRKINKEKWIKVKFINDDFYLIEE